MRRFRRAAIMFADSLPTTRLRRTVRGRGSNTIRFFNNTANAPDLDKIAVS
jgi:hypothetical protein